MNNWRGWIDYRGNKFTTHDGEDHGEHAERLLKKNYRGWSWKDDPVSFDHGVLYPSRALESKGWVRVVSGNSFSCSVLGDYQKQILRGLILKCRNGERIYCEIGKINLPRDRDAALEHLESM